MREKYIIRMRLRYVHGNPFWSAQRQVPTYPSVSRWSFEPRRSFAYLLLSGARQSYPRSERISAGPRLALRRAQHRDPRGGTTEANFPEQTTLPDEQHRLRGQHTRRTDHTGDRRREAIEPQPHRDGGLGGEDDQPSCFYFIENNRSCAAEIFLDRRSSPESVLVDPEEKSSARRLSTGYKLPTSH